MVRNAVTAEFHDPLLSRTTAPRWRERWLRRTRIDQLLAVVGDSRLTAVVAPAGFGKTLALAGLAERGGWPLAWCRVITEPAEALLRHLGAAFAPLAPPTISAATPEQFANTLAKTLDDETVLVLDDAHLLGEEASALVGWLLEWLPEQVHVVLAARWFPLGSLLAALVARGDAAHIGPAELAFSDEETRQLFAHRRCEEAEWRRKLTVGGWPIAVDLATRLTDEREASALLTAYIERELLEPLSSSDRRALLAMAAVADPAALPIVAAEVGRAFDEATVTALGGPLVGGLVLPPARTVLREVAQRDATWWRLLNRRVAERLGEAPAALEHWLLSGEDERARSLFERCADAWLATDPASVTAWFDRLYPNGAPAAAALAAARAHRAAGRPVRAWELAEQARTAAMSNPTALVPALHLLAELALDTVEPARARQPLQAARRLLGPDDPRCLTHLQLETGRWIDRGRPRQARRLLAAQPPLGGDDAVAVPPRLLLRTGRLAEARTIVERALGVGTPRGVLAAHREPALLLAYVDAVLGRGARALAMAQRSILEAQQAGHVLTEAVGWIRLGHAHQVASPLDPTPALDAYETAIAAARAVGVERTEAEAHLGRLLAAGHAGAVSAAEEAFAAATAIAARAGDRWLGAWALAARASVAVANGMPESAAWLDRAERALRRVEDEFGFAVVALWRAIAALEQGDDAGRPVETLFALLGRLGVDGLLTGPSLYGPRDTAALIPVLLRARATQFASRAEELLREAFPTVAGDATVTDYHPGYTLRVQLLGTFRVWRGRREVAPRDWQREKAKQLFQLLVTRRGRWLQREEICTLLWPDAALEAGEGQFKVALNALNAALEPRRPARTPPFFIRRNGLAYAFAPTSGVWIDVDEFDVRVEGAARGDAAFARRALASALALYRGDYLAESLYDPWTTEERERLLARYLRAALDLGQRLLAVGMIDDAIALGEAVLRRDRADERAHQLLMRAYALAGDRAAAARVYRRCRQAVQDELGAPPLPETDALFERIRLGLPVSS